MAKRILFTFTALLLSAACSTTPALTLTATPSSIGGDGQSAVTATAKVTSGGAAAPDDTVVHFTATDGILASMGTPSATPLALDATPTSGSATVQLIVPRRGRGSITITATASFNGATVTQSQVVNLIPSGGAATSLTFNCDSQNIGGMVLGRTDPIHVLCHAHAFNAAGEIANASIEPFAEAGSLTWQTGTDAMGNVSQYLVYTVVPGAPNPVDVDPLGTDGKPRLPCPATCINAPETCDAEPCWVDTQGTHNPRDGVATLMVAVPGAADFNSQGEPYVDVDDSGAYETGETYIDVNGNNKYDPADGSQQDTIMIWKEYRIIWSGSADTTTSGHGSHIVGTIADANLGNLTVRLNDRNFNKLSAVSPNDGFTLASSCTQGGTLDGLVFTATVPFDPTVPGILFDPDTGGIDGPGLASAYRQETDINLQSQYGVVTISGNTAPSTCNITATVSRSYDPGAEPIFPATGTSSNETVTGTFSFAASSDGGS